MAVRFQICGLNTEGAQRNRLGQLIFFCGQSRWIAGGRVPKIVKRPDAGPAEKNSGHKYRAQDEQSSASSLDEKVTKDFAARPSFPIGKAMEGNQAINWQNQNSRELGDY